MYNPDEECDKLIQVLSTLCEEKSMSYYNVATKAQLSTSTVHSLMSKKTKPYVHTLFKLCNAFGVKIETLLCDDKMEVDKKILMEQETLEQLQDLNEKDLVLFYRSLSAKKKETLLKYIEMLSQYNSKE